MTVMVLMLMFKVSQLSTKVSYTHLLLGKVSWMPTRTPSW